MQAIANAASIVGDSSCWVANLNSRGDAGPDIGIGEAFSVPFSKTGDVSIEKIDDESDYVLWSPRGEWVFFRPREWYLIAYGSSEVIIELVRSWPSWPNGTLDALSPHDQLDRFFREAQLDGVDTTELEIEFSRRFVPQRQAE